MNHSLMKVFLCLLILSTCSTVQCAVPYDVAISSDGERIAFATYGAGDTTLVFIHGWSCDSRYWLNQVSVFSKDYRVVAIDLAGHGNSSVGRHEHTMMSYATDVQAVMDKESIQKAILIGHSLGGGVIAEAARIMPEKVVGIIGIDTFHNVGEKVAQKVLDAMSQPFEGDFPKAMYDFVEPMFLKGAAEGLVRWVKEDMASAPPKIAVSAFRNYMGQYVNDDAVDILEELSVPVVSLNALLWPTNLVGNQKHIQRYTLFTIEGTGHFPMLEKPEEFNRHLLTAIHSLCKEP